MDTVRYNKTLNDLNVLEVTKKEKILELRDILLDSGEYSKYEIKRKIIDDLNRVIVDEDRKISAIYITKILGSEYADQRYNPTTDKQELRQKGIEEEKKELLLTNGEIESKIPTYQVTKENFNPITPLPMTQHIDDLPTERDVDPTEPIINRDPDVSDIIPASITQSQILDKKDKEIADLMDEISTLRDKNEQLLEENKQLKQKIADLEAQKPTPIVQKPVPVVQKSTPVTPNRAINPLFTKTNVHKEYLENRNRNLIKGKKL